MRIAKKNFTTTLVGNFLHLLKDAKVSHIPLGPLGTAKEPNLYFGFFSTLNHNTLLEYVMVN